MPQVQANLSPSKTHVMATFIHSSTYPLPTFPVAFSFTQRHTVHIFQSPLSIFVIDLTAIPDPNPNNKLKAGSATDKKEALQYAIVDYVTSWRKHTAASLREDCPAMRRLSWSTSRSSRHARNTPRVSQHGQKRSFRLVR
ncbi:hypothetical protein EDD22DRAFT_958637 [Suillus occidentalis]|nr:hypothetical protein EDD22DRAFT_958637 [Suillus occidentalis]